MDILENRANDPRRNPMIGITIAIDGPAGAGKGTLARNIARVYRMKYLDTGTLYRLIAYRVLQQGKDPSKERDALSCCDADDLINRFDFRHIGDNKFSTFLDGKEIIGDLRKPEVGAAASKVAFYTSIRLALKDFQMSFEARWRARTGVILDGRDIGTVICPKAEYKFFLDATPEVRAKRRVLEMEARGYALNYQEALAQILERDARDRGRTEAPLKAADDAVTIDTSDLSEDDVVRTIVKIIGADRMFDGEGSEEDIRKYRS